MPRRGIHSSRLWGRHVLKEGGLWSASSKRTCAKLTVLRDVRPGESIRPEALGAANRPRIPPDPMLRRLYDWTLSLSARPSAPYALAAVSFAESSFFPVPPDVMLVPMILARPDRAWFYATVCTAASVVGGILGYLIGYLLYDSLGAWLFQIYGLTEGADAFRHSYAEYGHWIILLKGLTPIPYKLVTITSGFAGYNLAWFVMLSVLTRGARFFIVALLMSSFGPAIKPVIERHFNVVAFVSVAAIVGGFVAFRYLF